MLMQMRDKRRQQNLDFIIGFPDPRAKTLPLMDTPVPTAIFIVLYLAWVVVLGPFFMRDRKPFSLRNTLIYYNAFQVTLSAYMFYEVSSGKCLNVKRKTQLSHLL